MSTPRFDDTNQSASAEAERYRAASAIVDAVLDRAPSEREAYIAMVTANDPALQRLVERLLRAYSNAPSDFLAEPAVRVVGPLLGAVTLREGERVGRYRLQRIVGEGGMGVVWLARDDALERDVALKFVRASATTDPRAAHEARAVARLDHPHVAGILEVGELADGVTWMAMPYCAGGSLAGRLRAGALPVSEALRIARELASALGAAHEQQVVHRDVKPANVLFDAEGRVRLADFGIAKLTDAETTGHSGVVGTVAYLSPEQVGGERIDHRADLWALGVTLYEMLAGARPFDGEGYGAILNAILTKEPPPLTRRDVPPALVSLVSDLLRKQRDARPASAREVERALEAIAAGKTHDSPQSGSREPAHRRVRWALGLSLAGLAIVVAPRMQRPAIAPNVAPAPAVATSRRAASASSAAAPSAGVLTGTDDVEARAAYLQARFEKGKRSPVALATAAGLLERAVARDPQFTRAWAALANVLVLQGVFGKVPMTTVGPRARDLAERAIAMDSTVAEAHAALGHVLRVYDYDWEGSLRETARALALDPADESVVPLHAIGLLSLRRYAEAESVIAAGRRRNPADPSLDLTLGRVQLAKGDARAAGESFRRVLEVQPGFGYAVQQLGYALIAQGRYREALPLFQRVASSGDMVDSGNLAHALARSGRVDEARRIAQTLEATDERRYVDPEALVIAWAGIGDADRAFAWIDRAWRERAPIIQELASSPLFQPLHRDRRWRPLLQRLQLPP